MTENERRLGSAPSPRLLAHDLNEDQREMLRALENFGWELKFIRRIPFQPPVAVVFDGDRKKFAVLEADGTLNENPGFEIRG